MDALMSINPEWVQKILNGSKLIEVRKQFLGWCGGNDRIYIYCTKTGKNHSLDKSKLGKIVGYFKLDFAFKIEYDYFTRGYLISDDDIKLTCLSQDSLLSY